MKVLTCAAARRRLQAFHDEELQIGDQIAVAAHLDRCGTCAASFADLRFVRASLRAVAPGRVGLSKEEQASLQATVVNRVKAEQTTSWAAQTREMFDDMHLVYAGVGAAAAALVCVVIMLGMMRLATPGSNDNPVQLELDARVRMPRAMEEPFTTTLTSDDIVFMLAAVVTREGTITNLELLTPQSGQTAAPGPQDAKEVEDLMGDVSRARFEPATVEGLPVAVNMVWLVAHTTVRPAEPALDLPIAPTAKKRVAALYVSPPSGSVLV